MRSAEPKSTARRVRFGDVVRLCTDRCVDPAAEGIERYVGLEHLEPGNLRIRKWGLVDEGTTFTNRFQPGQVLFGKRRAYQRKVAIADFEGVCSGDIYVLEPADAALHPDLLPFLCQTDAFFDHAVGTSAGSLSPRTNWKSLADFEFFLPSTSEQRRLVVLLVQIEKTLSALADVENIAERLRRSFLVHSFRPNRGATDEFPQHWMIKRIVDVGDVQLGQQRHPKYSSGENVRPYLRVANVMDGWIDYSDVYKMHFPRADLGKFELLPGDILLNEGQSTELVGRSAIYHGELDGCCFQKTLLRFRPSRRLSSDFAHAFFQHYLYTGQFARIAVQTTSIAHLTGVRFEKMLIPVPAKKEQDEITGRNYELNRAACEARRRRERLQKVKAQLLTEWASL